MSFPFDLKVLQPLLGGRRYRPRFQRSDGHYVHLRDVPCRLACAFCISGAHKRKPNLWKTLGLGKVRPPTPTERASDRRRIVADVEGLLGRTPPGSPLELTADDLLEFDGLFDIVRAFERVGRCFALATPGLRLADEAFARELARFPVRLTLSHSTQRPITGAQLLGDAKAPAKIQAALSNLIRFDVDFNVNTIVTSYNQDELVELGIQLCEELGRPGLTLPCFYLEQVMLSLDPDAPRLYPSYDRVDRQLRHLLRRWSHGRYSVHMLDFPPCQFSEEVLACRWIHWGFNTHEVSPTPAPWAGTCRACPVGARCNRVPLYYRRIHPGALPDSTLVCRHLSRP